MFESYYVREACSTFDTVIVNEKLHAIVIIDGEQIFTIKSNDDLINLVNEYSLPFC